MAPLGHFGKTGMIAGAAAFSLLVLHLAVPFAWADHSQEQNDFGQRDETLSRADMAQAHDDARGYGPAAPGIALAGAVIALIGGAFLVLGSFLPVGVTAARFIGWSAGLVGSLGAFMAVWNSAYWLGVGLTTFTTAILPNPEPAVHLWVISPVVVFLAGGIALLAFMRTMVAVVSKRDGLRSQAQRQTQGALWAVLFLVGVLALPWSVQVLDGDERRSMGLCSEGVCSQSYAFFTAYGHGGQDIASQVAFAPFGGILDVADATQGGDPGLFQGLALSLKVMTAVGWLGFLLPALATFGPLLSSAFRFPAAARYLPSFQLFGLPILLWGTVMFVLACSFMWKPSWASGAFFGGPVSQQSWWFAFLPAAAALPLVLHAVSQVQTARHVLRGLSGLKPAQTQVHTFD